MNAIDCMPINISYTIKIAFYTNSNMHKTCTSVVRCQNMQWSVVMTEFNVSFKSKDERFNVFSNVLPDKMMSAI